MNQEKIKISGLGRSLGSKKITNFDLEKILDTSDDWIRKRTGIKHRYISDHVSITDLSTIAAKEALDNAGLLASEIDLIISATSIPDSLYPSTACEVQKNIKAYNAVAFNIVAACSGFIFAMKTALQFLHSSTYKKVLILGGDLHSRFLNWEDRTTSILFSDGAGAMILEKNNQYNDILDTQIFSNPIDSQNLTLPLFGKTPPFLKEKDSDLQENSSYVNMNGSAIFKFSIDILPKAIMGFLKKNKTSLKEIDYIIPHQANNRIIEKIAEKLNYDPSKMISEIWQFGNTSAASIPITFMEAIQNGKIKFPSKIILIGFGAGLTWGISLIHVLHDKLIK